MSLGPFHWTSRYMFKRANDRIPPLVLEAHTNGSGCGLQQCKEDVDAFNQALWQAAQVLLRHLFWQTRHLSKIELAVVPPLLMVKMHQLIQSRSIASLKTELFHFLSWSPTMSHLFAIHCAFCNRNFTYFNDLLHVWLCKHCFAWSHSP